MEETSINNLVRCMEELKTIIGKSVMLKPSYTNEEVLDMFGVSNPTLRKWRRDGLLGYSQVGTIYLYSQQDIAEFLQKHHIEAFA